MSSSSQTSPKPSTSNIETHFEEVLNPIVHNNMSNNTGYSSAYAESMKRANDHDHQNDNNYSNNNHHHRQDARRNIGWRTLLLTFLFDLFGVLFIIIGASTYFSAERTRSGIDIFIVGW